MAQGSTREAVERWEAWWERTNTGPLITVIYPRTRVDYAPVTKPWMAPSYTRGWSTYLHEFAFGQAVELAWREHDMRYVEEALVLLERCRDATGSAGGAFPFVFANVGAMMLPALLTEQTRFLGDTVWVGAEPALELDQIVALEHRPMSGYAETVLEALSLLVERLGEYTVIAPPELGSSLDALSALRGNQNLALDLLLAPELVQVAAASIERLWWRWRRRFAEGVDRANDGLYTECFRYLSCRPTLTAECDFSAMISPVAFEEFYLPFLQRQLDIYGNRTVFHLDGPGMLPHVAHLCAQPQLHSIQWVYGAGNPHSLDERWYDLYRTVLDAGKRVCFCSAPTDPDAIRRFFGRFPATEFMLPFTATDEREADALVRLADHDRASIGRRTRPRVSETDCTVRA